MLEIRKHRIFGFSIFDIVVSFIGMTTFFLILWKWHFPKLNPFNFVFAAFGSTITFGIIFHVIFGVNTELNYRLGLSYKPKDN